MEFAIPADQKVKLEENEERYVVYSMSFQTFLYRHLKS